MWGVRKGEMGSGFRSRVVWLSSSQPFPPGAGERRVPNLQGLSDRLDSSSMLHPGTPFLRLSEMKFASTCRGPNYPWVGKGKERKGRVEKVQKEREKGNQGRLDTPCSFPTLGRRGANRSDQIHFPESIFCFVNTLCQPFPAHSFSPILSRPFPTFKPPFFPLEECDGGLYACVNKHTRTREGGSMFGSVQESLCASPAKRPRKILISSWTTDPPVALGLVLAASALRKPRSSHGTSSTASHAPDPRLRSRDLTDSHHSGWDNSELPLEGPWLCLAHPWDSPC